MKVVYEAESDGGEVMVRWTAQITGKSSLTLTAMDVLQRRTKRGAYRITRSWQQNITRAEAARMKSENIEIINQRPPIHESVIAALLKQAREQIVWSNQ